MQHSFIFITISYLLRFRDGFITVKCQIKFDLVILDVDIRRDAGEIRLVEAIRFIWLYSS